MKLRSAWALSGSRSSTGLVELDDSFRPSFCSPTAIRISPKSSSRGRRSHSRVVPVIDQRAPGSGCRHARASCWSTTAPRTLRRIWVR